MNSMTGFGRATTQLGATGLVVEVNSVNRRNLEVVVAVPKEWQSFEKPLGDEVRSMLDRGRVTVSVQTQDMPDSSPGRIDEAGLSATLKTLREFADREGLDFSPDSALMFQIAWQHRVGPVLPDAEDARESVLGCIREALADLCAMRRREGAAMGADLESRVLKTITWIEEIRTETSGSVAKYRDLLFQRLRQSGLELDLDDERVLREIALFADRCDISEELTRLESHFEQFLACLGEDGTIGRKLEFLLQEIGRELNTVGAKANNIKISGRVVDAKSEFEKIREQIQNVE
jgi:uncharacterized protein (TIGR00255 family)